MQALVDINGTHEDAYKHLPQYCKDLENSNPNSVIVLENTADNKFKRLFISYGASATGFAHCRPLLGLDGTHLKAKYQGIIIKISHLIHRYFACSHCHRCKW
jgi:hypothetical protein